MATMTAEEELEKLFSKETSDAERNAKRKSFADIIAALLDAGYFRVKITSLSVFDKVIGGEDTVQRDELTRRASYYEEDKLCDWGLLIELTILSFLTLFNIKDYAGQLLPLVSLSMWTFSLKKISP